MKDKQQKISCTTIRCLITRLNGYAEMGRITTPYIDAVEILEKRGGCETAIAELKNREAHSFAKRAPVAEQRYRRSRFSDGNFVVSFWHEDAEGEWIFIPDGDDRFTVCDSPGGTGWRISNYRTRGEFRKYEQVAAALGEADILADAELAE